MVKPWFTFGKHSGVKVLMAKPNKPDILPKHIKKRYNNCTIPKFGQVTMILSPLCLSISIHRICLPKRLYSYMEMGKINRNNKEKNFEPCHVVELASQDFRTVDQASD